MWNLISTRVTQFAYFDRLLDSPVWKGKKILDFGGNVGTFLVGAGDRVDHDDYWCVDLNSQVIELGRVRFPLAHFVHYDRYSSQFNPNGVRYMPVPDCGLRFDIILAFSVFTHVHLSELVELVGQLRDLLNPQGVLAFTFCDPAYDRSLSDPSLPHGSDVRKNLEQVRLRNSSRDIDEIVVEARRSRWCVLIDEQLHVEPSDQLCLQKREGNPGESYCSYFAADFMQSLFPSAKVVPPVSPEWQHCCILRADAAKQSR